MKGKKLLCIVLSLTAVCSLLLVRDSAAWLDTKTATSPTSLIVVDKMAFSFDGTLGTYLEYATGSNAGDPYLVTEQNLIVTNGGKITATNYSTIDTEVRFKIYYDTPGHYYANNDDSDPSNDALVYTGSATDSLSAEIGSKWVLNTTDNYYYYNDSQSTAYYPAVTGTPAPVDVITNIMYLDELYVNGSDVLLHSDYFPAGGDPFAGSVHIIFQAKQKDYVDWATITTWATP